MPVEITEIFYPKSRREWRQWLEANHSTQTEIWLRRLKKATDKPCITYDELVEECLCFGWIKECRERRREEAIRLRAGMCLRSSGGQRKRLNWLIKNTRQGKMYGTVPIEE